MKSFFRAMDQTDLAEKFPGISAAKIKEGVFIGPQIHRLFRREQLTAFSLATRRRRGMFSDL